MNYILHQQVRIQSNKSEVLLAVHFVRYSTWKCMMPWHVHRRINAQCHVYRKETKASERASEREKENDSLPSCLPKNKRAHTHAHTHAHANATHFVLFAFITRNSSLEPLLEGLLAQIHLDLPRFVCLNSQFFGRNRTRDLQITNISVRCRAHIHWGKVTNNSLKIYPDLLLNMYIHTNNHIGRNRTGDLRM